MFPIERREKIMEYLEENGSITVEELAKKLEVTSMTIRRDLKYLEENNRITRTFGGAVTKDGLVDEVAVSQKAATFHKEKKRIAKTAVEMVENGQTVILDAGTTNMEIALELIRNEKEISVVTGDILIAAALLEVPHIEVYCTGGHVQKYIGACLGGHAEAFFREINADIAFIGASAVDVEKGVSSPTQEKAMLKKQQIDCAEKKILVTDSSKFGKISFAKICGLDTFDLMITDKELDDKIAKSL
ncbi:MAG: DeoR/GlpR family DNA-binding transcription regulator, partial [Eubacterium sp.]